MEMQPAGGSLFVAGIGASAGGLEALQQLLARLGRTGRLCVVIAQHMAHGAHSELTARLLDSASILPVHIARDGEALAPDTVLLVPAGQDGVVRGGRISLRAPEPGCLSTPSVNVLFGSIAREFRSHAIGIVLSGAGSDGATGCRELHAAGGTVFAQEPTSAGFDGMRSAARATGTVGQVLTPESIACALVARFAAVSAVPAAGALPSNAVLHRVLQLVRERTGMDFSGYKEETLLRRLERRSADLGIDGIERYAATLARRPEEARELAPMFLVSLSSFFRDRESFSRLSSHLCDVLHAKPDDTEVRVWVPGCAFGEEALSIAVLVSECLRERPARRPVSILGWDLNQAAIDAARAGVYAESAFREMDAALMARYFRPYRGQLQPVEELRAMCRFERRDLLGPEVPEQLDLISCRNLLIYFKSGLQDWLMQRFHDALRPRGLLFIGQSETVGIAGSTLFSALSEPHRVFSRRMPHADRR